MSKAKTNSNTKNTPCTGSSFYRRALTCLTALIMSVSALAACGEVDSSQAGPAPAQQGEGEMDSSRGGPAPAQQIEAVNISKEITAASVSGKEPDSLFRESQYSFAVNLFKECFDGRSNTAVSPLSVMLALSMTANGADGATLEQMESALGGIPIDELNRYLYDYTDALKSDEFCKLGIANSIWVKTGTDVKKSFLQTNADYYGAQAFMADFDSQTLDDINGWVSENTDGMIDKIINKIDPQTFMYLINALVFEAQWSEPYEDVALSDGEFTSIDGSTSTVTMMHSSEYIYIRDEKGGAQGFIKPYKGNFEFAVLLPDEDIGIDMYISSMTEESLSSAFSQTRTDTVVTASMPKFKFDYSDSLVNELTSLGISDAFDGIADFTRITDSSACISDVIHKVHIEVDNYGTKAAAVTAVIMNEAAAVFDDTVSITLDRPFVFAIIDKENKLPIFIGAVTDVEA